MGHFQRDNLISYAAIHPVCSVRGAHAMPLIPFCALTPSGTFCEATSFNQPLDEWDVSNVRFLYSALLRCARWHAPSRWHRRDLQWLPLHCTSPCVPLIRARGCTRSGTFLDASAFNQPLNSWDTSTVENMKGNAATFHPAECACAQAKMTPGAEGGGAPLGVRWGLAWDRRALSPVAAGLFNHANSFNQPLDAWDTSQVTDISCALRALA